VDESGHHWCIMTLHDGSEGAVPGAVHRSWVYSSIGVPPPIYYGSLILHSSEEMALLELAALCAFPLQLQRVCIYCHPWRSGDIVPRYNEYGGVQPAYVVPVVAEDWLSG
jgi:hypothetical protein